MKDEAEAAAETERVVSELNERVKELRCLYAVSQIVVDTDLTRLERLQRIVNALPEAWQRPLGVAARMTLDGELIESPGYDGAGPGQSADLVVNGVRRGTMEVAYTATAPPGLQPAFLSEEQRLLENIARQVSLFVTREEGAERRAGLESQLRHVDRLATIGQLAAGVAHEMNEPLSSILGFAQLAQKDPGVPGQVAADLSEIVAACLRAREVVKSLLLFARQAPLEPARVDLNEVVGDAMFLLEAASENQRIRWERDLEPDLPPIEADPIQVRQVLVNLVVNAMQAIAAVGTVTVTTRADGGQVVLSVTDTGVGMSREVLGRVFHPFFTTKDVGAGTGLGLSVVHGIVTSHGGTVEAESREGEGSRFTVRLPAADHTRPHRAG